MNNSKKVKKQTKSPRKITDIFKKIQEKNSFKQKTRTGDEEIDTPSKRKCTSPCSSSVSDVKTRSPLKQIKPGEVSPNAQKIRIKLNKTPLKLFERSPKKIQGFCVETIEKFVKITPSKSNPVTPSKSGKFIEIDDECSPSTSTRSVQAQKHNEMTPVKEPNKISNELSESKVKTKLNFTSCTSSTSQSKENVECLNTFMSEEEITAMLSEYSMDTDTIEPEPNYTLDLRKTKRCEIVKIEKSKFRMLIYIKSSVDGEMGVCSLEDFWFNMKLNVGDLVNLTAKKINNEWSINNKHGAVIYEPDLLIPTTSVVNSLFCRRRNVLEQKYRGFERTNEFMLFGSVVHQVLQETLRKQLKTQSSIEELITNILNSKEMVKNLYETDVTLDAIREKMATFYLPRIVEFVQNYIVKEQENQVKNKWNDKKNWKGKIVEIEDIEESVWCPSLGIKGKIDVTVKTDAKTVKPLELKTGKASFSMEHKGQVALYIMMMKKLGYKVTSGLLLYLRDGIISELTPTENEQRDILMLRNEHAFYLKQKPEIHQNNIRPAILPEPIDHVACKKCPYSNICTSYLRYEKTPLSNYKILDEIIENELQHLTKAHLDFFMKWSALISLEETVNLRDKKVEDIYTIPPSVREINGRCISHLRIIEISKEHNGNFDHTFEKNRDETGLYNFYSAGITDGSYVVVSLDKRPAICTGFVTHIDAHSITITLDKNLRVKYPFEHFHIDTYVSSFTFTFSQSALALLLESSESSQQLRDLIIDKKDPEFSMKLPKKVADLGRSLLKKLNRTQRAVVLKAISAKDYLLVHGMPGTGKTTTMAILIQLLVETGKTVLVTSHTHSAVDNICVKLAQSGVDFLRLGSGTRVQEPLKKYTESYKTENCKTPEELAQVYNEAKIIATTCLSTGHPLFTKRNLDVCIVDESTQLLQPIVIKPLHVCKTFILIGDPEQLPPVIRNTEAAELGMSESLFESLRSPRNTVSMNINYRMNSTITELANKMTYKGRLLVDETTSGATLQLKHVPTQPKWVLNILDTCIENSVKIIDVGSTWKLKDDVPWSVKNENNRNLFSVHETAVIFNLIHALQLGGVNLENIGVIATYIWQVKQLSTVLNRDILVNSVDQFQGKDKDVIIYSCTKSSESKHGDKKFHILEDHRRLNVAITRAKKKLIIIGDMSTMSFYAPFVKLLECVHTKHVMKLIEGTDEFSWENVLGNVKQKTQD